MGGAPCRLTIRVRKVIFAGQRFFYSCAPSVDRGSSGLDRYLYKENVQDLCDELGLPVGGNKDELIFRVLGAPQFQPEMALAHVDKEGLKQLCDELGLRTQGTRDDLVDRVLQEIRARP